MATAMRLARRLERIIVLVFVDVMEFMWLWDREEQEDHKFEAMTMMREAMSHER